jgi:glycosyltransferase involved in cell wall biosynthesis
MKRVLVGGDTSTANSGFAVYKRNVLKGLMDCGLFEVGEVGYGGSISDRERVPWRYYPTAVAPDDPRFNEYRNNPANEYGVWRWEAIANDFKLTNFFAADDPWQCAHTIMSPLRPYYSIVYSPTVDSIPQRQDFLQMFAQVDSLYAYTEWGCKYLNENGLNCQGAIGMGIDPNVMKPLDKKELRRKYRLPEDAIIFGFVARNQLRKRFPELIEAFKLYLEKAPPDIAAKSYLYLHTSSPDAGWNLATHLLDSGTIHKVLFTYMCRKTGELFITTYKDDRTYSPFSGEMSAFMPNVVYSPPENKLNEIYNLMDCYVQCSNCEGLGAPTIEAAASNVYTVGTDYAGTGELVRKFGGYPVPVLMNFDHNVMANRAAIDPEVWSEALLKYALERPTVNSRLTVLQKYTWTHIIDKVIRAIDEAPLPKWSWSSPLKQYGLPPLKGDMTATQFIHLLSSHVPHLKWSGFNLLNLRTLNTQIDLRGKQLMMVTPEVIAQRYKEIIEKINHWERVRCGEPTPKEDYLYASS